MGWQVRVLGLMVGVLAGCGNEGLSGVPDEPEREAVVGYDSFLYFRCNATSWELNEQSRLEPGGDIYTFVLTYEVTADWMTTAGDDCVLTEANARDRWDAGSLDYGILGDSTVPIEVPGGARLRGGWGGGDVHFRVRYPAPGPYTIRVNWRSGSFLIEAEPTPEEESSSACRSAQAKADAETMAATLARNICLAYNPLHGSMTHLTSSACKPAALRDCPDLVIHRLVTDYLAQDRCPQLSEEEAEEVFRLDALQELCQAVAHIMYDI